MACTYDVQANIVHASKCTPTGKEHILLDTQVLLWMFYPKFSSLMPGINPPARDQLKIYPAFLKSLFSAKGMLYYTGFNLAGVVSSNRTVRMRAARLWDQSRNEIQAVPP